MPGSRDGAVVAALVLALMVAGGCSALVDPPWWSAVDAGADGAADGSGFIDSRDPDAAGDGPAPDAAADGPAPDAPADALVPDGPSPDGPLPPDSGPPRPTITVGSGGQHATFEDALAVANSGDTIRLVSDLSASFRIEIDGKTDLWIDLGGHTLSRSSAGSGFRVLGSSNVRLFNGAVSGICGGTYGNGVEVSGDSAYVLIEGLTIEGFTQSAVLVVPGSLVGRPGTSAEHVWIEGCTLRAVNQCGSLPHGSAIVTIYQPGVVAGVARPAWWDARLAARGFAGDTDLRFAVVDNALDSIVDVIADTDGSGILISDWRWILSDELPPYDDGKRFALIENNVVLNVERMGIRLLNSPGPHVVRNNTIYAYGQITPSYAGENAAIVLEDSGAPAIYNAQIYNNLIYGDGTTAGGMDQDSLTSVTSGSSWTHNWYYRTGGGELGAVGTSDPKVVGVSLGDPDGFKLQAGSPLIDKGKAGALSDRLGVARPAGQGTDIGAYER